MSRRMKKQALFLTFLNAANKKQQTLLLKSLTSDQLDVIGEISLNIYTGVLKISKRDKNELLPYKNDIRLLSPRDKIYKFSFPWEVLGYYIDLFQSLIHENLVLIY